MSLVLSRCPSTQEQVRKNLRKTRPDLAALLESESASVAVLRDILVRGPYPGIGTGDPDLYKAFSWRFVALSCRDMGRIGVVLPRSMLSEKGGTEFRLSLLTKASLHVTFLVNNAKWVFPEVHPQYTVCLTEITLNDAGGLTVGLAGPYSSLQRFVSRPASDGVRFPNAEVASWTDTAAFPLLPAEESAAVFAHLRQSPRLDTNDHKTWRARPYTELHSTHDKPLMVLREEPPDTGLLARVQGESFDLWDSDKGTYYAWCNPKKIVKHLLAKRSETRRNSKSPFFEFIHRPSSWFNEESSLACNAPRITWRKVTRSTDSRTVRCALVPPRVLLSDSALSFLWPRGEERDEAYLLGVLSSLVLDWYARRFVEVNLNFFVMNPFPIPRPDRDNPLWQRTVALAGRLACPDKRFAKWAKAVGVECGKLDAAEKDDMIAELDAVVAHLYGLTEPHLRHIFETFHEGWDYQPRLTAVLAHYKAWAGKVQNGEKRPT